MSDSMSSDAPRPRLCHLRKWPDFNGYGFNLHAERGKAGQFIGNVDPDSPAVAANLRPGDRIVQVNGTSIGSENHQQVVQRIKAVPDETKLLVVDQETDDYYKERKMVVPSDMYSVDVCEAPVTNPFTNPSPEAETSFNAMKISDAGPEDDSTEQTEMPDAVPVMEYAAASYDYEARLCHLKMWPDFAGYGFNLHADRATPGQFVGKVDEGSPAEAAGLRLNDRIVEVNGHSVEGRSHADVVADVKSVSGEVRLLVVDADTDEMCRQSGVVLSSSCLTSVQTIICPDSNPYTSMSSVQLNGEEEVVTSTMSLPPTEHEDEFQNAHTADDDDDAAYSAAVNIETREYEEERTHEQPQHSAIVENVSVATSSAKPVATSRQVNNPAGATVNMAGPTATARSTITVGGIEFAGSAKEARERMKKKANVKQDPSLSLRDKYELLQKL